MKGELSVSVLADDATLNDTHEVTDVFVAAFIEAPASGREQRFPAATAG